MGPGGINAALSPLDAIAERRILEAQARGEFDDLPGAGAPLQLDDDPLVAEELRAACRVLKNAGFVPPELEVHREIREIEVLMAAAGCDSDRERLRARIRFLTEPRLRPAARRQGGGCLARTDCRAARGRARPVTPLEKPRTTGAGASGSGPPARAAIRRIRAARCGRLR